MGEPVKKLPGYLFIIFLLIGCHSEKLTQEELNSEKERVQTRIENFLNAYANKDMDSIMPMLAGSEDFQFFGSDVSEVNKSKADFQNQIDQDWKLFKTIQFGELRNLSIKISDCGDLAVASYEIPMAVSIGETQSKFIFRMSNAFIKDQGLWKLVQGFASIPSTGQSSVELANKLSNQPK